MGTATRILVVIGTRPEAVKMAPLVRALAQDDRFVPIVCTTGQHRELLAETLAAFDMAADVALDLMRPRQRPAELAARVLTAIDETISRHRPDWVCVQGDTTTTVAATQAAFYARVPVAHLEAGLRSGRLDRPFPEEGNRRQVATLATLHFAPTQGARRNLLDEGVDGRRVHVTGNTVIDALLWMAEKVRRDAALAQEMATLLPACKRCRRRAHRLILVTSHRRESFGQGLANICAALLRIAERPDVAIVYPVHPNPAVHASVHRLLGGHPRIHLLAPLDYRRFVWLLVHADLILTDSGGIQEEAPALGKPVLVLRTVTERPEALAHGAARLIGTAPERIVTETLRLLDDPTAYAAMAKRRLLFGDGHAAERIVATLAKEIRPRKS